jgi:hypothetical protein
MTAGRVDQANVPDALRSHLRRIAILEAVLPGIRFDTEPQAGHWLDIETTAADGFGYGIRLVATSDSGIYIFANGSEYGELKLSPGGNGIVTLNGEEGFELTSSGATGGLIDPSGPLTLSSQQAITIKPGYPLSSGDLVIDLRNGDHMIVNDHLGNPIFTLTG